MADKKEIREILLRLQQQSPSGVAIAFHIKFTTPDFLFQTYPTDWTSLYSERGYVMSDPTVRWGFDNTGAKRWTDMLDDDTLGIFKESKAFGLEYGVTVALEKGGSRSFASFSRDDREYTDEEIAAMIEDVERLHVMTKAEDGMPEHLRDELHKLSISMTHQGRRKA